MEKGRVGESYIICGPSHTLTEVFALAEKITGIPATKLWAPGWLAAGLSRLAAVFEAMGMTMQFSAEALGSLADYPFWGNPDKARRELGWQSRPVEDVLREIVEEVQKRK